MPSIDIINAASKFRKRLDAGESYDDVWTLLTNSYNMTTKEMDELAELLKGERKIKQHTSKQSKDEIMAIMKDYAQKIFNWAEKHGEEIPVSMMSPWLKVQIELREEEGEER